MIWHVGQESVVTKATARAAIITSAPGVRDIQVTPDMMMVGGTMIGGMMTDMVTTAGMMGAGMRTGAATTAGGMAGAATVEVVDTV
jgi:hypothetical protein